jgi:chromosome partitioning protein
MHTIAIFNTKGGTGKSAVTVFLADFLCSEFKKRVLVIDLDWQNSSSVALLGEDVLQGRFAENVSLTRMMDSTLQGIHDKSLVESYLTERPAIEGRGKHKYLRRLHVVAAKREHWHEMDDYLRRAAASGKTDHNLLRMTLSPIEKDFDICLIDFPGNEVGPLARVALAASDWWLFPTNPDRVANRATPICSEIIREMQSAGHSLRPLGTLLTRCQMRTGNEYRKAKRTLEELAKQRIVPQLFSRDAEISEETSAKNALDELDTREFRTLAKKYGSSTARLHKSLRRLTREVLDRLKVPVSPAERLTFRDHLSELIAKVWR